MSITKTINLSRKKIISSTGKALKDFSMIDHGDKIMVCISGGKDSYTMLEMFIHFQKYGDIDFDFIVVNMDQKQPSNNYGEIFIGFINLETVHWLANDT